MTAVFVAIWLVVIFGALVSVGGLGLASLWLLGTSLGILLVEWATRRGSGS